MAAAVEEHRGRQRGEHRGRAAVVVRLRVGDDEGVEVLDARAAQLGDDRRSRRAGVDQDGVAAGLQERRVAVATYFLRGLPAQATVRRPRP